VRILYTLTVVLVVISSFLLIFPAKLTAAANCSAKCDTGEVISIQDATRCSCIDNVGCVWRRDGQDHAKKFAGTELCIAAVVWNDR